MLPEDVKQKAKQVNDTSLDYHLSHAIFASNKITAKEFENYISERGKELKERLLAAEKISDSKAREARIAEISKEIDHLGKPYRIHVEYLRGDNVKGRAVFLPESNQFIISLPESMLHQSRNKDGSYILSGVKALRELVAHELGHIVLHTERFLQNHTTQGTLMLRGPQEEEDANLFAQELLALRYKRNEGLFTTGNWKAFGNP